MKKIAKKSYFLSMNNVQKTKFNTNILRIFQTHTIIYLRFHFQHCYTYIVILIFNKNNTTSNQFHYETHMDKDIESTPFYHNKINYWNSFPYSIKSITELHLYKWNVMLCRWLSLICKNQHVFVYSYYSFYVVCLS